MTAALVSNWRRAQQMGREGRLPPNKSLETKGAEGWLYRVNIIFAGQQRQRIVHYHREVNGIKASYHNDGDEGDTP